MKSVKIKLYILSILCLLLLSSTACSGSDGNSDNNNSTPSFQYQTEDDLTSNDMDYKDIPQMDTSLSHVFSELIFALDDPKIGIVDNTLSYPIYHNKYGSYFLGKLVETYVDINGIIFSAIEMEDGVIRHIPAITINDGFGFHVRYSDNPKDYIFEELYFKGAMTEKEFIFSVYEVTSSLFCSDTLEPIIYYDWNSKFFWEDNIEELSIKNETELLDFLLTTPMFENCVKITSPYGMRSIYNPKSTTYTFLYGYKVRHAYEDYENIVEIYEEKYVHLVGTNYINNSTTVHQINVKYGYIC